MAADPQPQPETQPEPESQDILLARHLLRSRPPPPRRPAATCDLDHTVPYDNGGITCECGVGPA